MFPQIYRTGTRGMSLTTRTVRTDGDKPPVEPELLLDEFSDLIRGVVRIIAPLADVEDIEDITVATLEAAVEAWPRFRSKSYRIQRFWILKIARCKTMDHFRKTKRRPEICVSSLLSSNGTANNEVL